jgi:hypothetical protein
MDIQSEIIYNLKLNEQELNLLMVIMDYYTINNDENSQNINMNVFINSMYEI